MITNNKIFTGLSVILAKAPRPMVVLRCIIVSVLCLVYTCSGFGDDNGVTLTGQTKNQKEQTDYTDSPECYDANNNKKNNCVKDRRNGICMDTIMSRKPLVTKYRCHITECLPGEYLVVKQIDSGLIRSQGYCINDTKCRRVQDIPACSKGNCALVSQHFPEEQWENKKIGQTNPLVTLQDENNKFTCQTKFNKCTNEAKKSQNMEDGFTWSDTTNAKDESLFYCKPKKCKNGYILPKGTITPENASCQKCPECEPGTGATCRSNGSDGENECKYTTTCGEGYNQTPQNAGKYNPICTPNTYKIKYKSNNEEINTDCPTSYTYGVGATINCAPTKDGYNFAGWCTDAALSDCNTTQTIDKDAKTDITFYADWRKKECTEKFPNNEEAIACCEKQGEEAWNGTTCNCADGYRWNGEKCIELGECEVAGITETHTDNYNKAIELIKNAYMDKARTIIEQCKATPGYIDKDSLECVEIKNAE